MNISWVESGGSAPLFELRVSYLKTLSSSASVSPPPHKSLIVHLYMEGSRPVSSGAGEGVGSTTEVGRGRSFVRQPSIVAQRQGSRILAVVDLDPEGCEVVAVSPSSPPSSKSPAVDESSNEEKRLSSSSETRRTIQSLADLQSPSKLRPLPPLPISPNASCDANESLLSSPQSSTQKPARQQSIRLSLLQRTSSILAYLKGGNTSVADAPAVTEDTSSAKTKEREGEAGEGQVNFTNKSIVDNSLLSSDSALEDLSHKASDGSSNSSKAVINEGDRDVSRASAINGDYNNRNDNDDGTKLRRAFSSESSNDGEENERVISNSSSSSSEDLSSSSSPMHPKSRKKVAVPRVQSPLKPVVRPSPEQMPSRMSMRRRSLEEEILIFLDQAPPDDAENEDAMGEGDSEGLPQQHEQPSFDSRGKLLDLSASEDGFHELDQSNNGKERRPEEAAGPGRSISPFSPSTSKGPNKILAIAKKKEEKTATTTAGVTSASAAARTESPRGGRADNASSASTTCRECTLS